MPNDKSRFGVLCLVFLMLASVPVSTNSASGDLECKCVAFRLDDIQDYYQRSEQIAMMELFKRNSAPLTVGVIANAFGQDKILVDYVKNNSNIEIANHGWNHESFIEFTGQEQSQLLAKSNEKIHAVLGTKPVTLILPFNAFNENTVAAAIENDLEVISADLIVDPVPGIDDKGLHHMPATANLSDWSAEEGKWLRTERSQVLVDILAGVENHGHSVVMMHPHDYDESELQSLINEVRLNNLRIVTMADIAGVKNVPEFQPGALFLAISVVVGIGIVFHRLKINSATGNWKAFPS